MKHRHPTARHTRTATAVACALGLCVLAAACGPDASGPPEIVLDRSVCSGCGMLISDLRFAAAYRAGERTASFDDIGCLLATLDREGLVTAVREGDAASAVQASAADQAKVWFLDDQGSFHTAGEVVFVSSPELASPMNGGIQAYADRAAAERVAESAGGVLIESLEELRASRRASVTLTEKGTAHEPTS